mgnify:FL=1
MARFVELMAKELAEWADTTVCYVQDPCGTAWPCKLIPLFDDGCWGFVDNFIDHCDEAAMLQLDISSNYTTSIVNKDQWQAERDKQKGGEWKRHRGGKCPVCADQQVEVKFRDGVIQQSHASDFFGWKHGELDNSAAEVMQYRVISQPQAEEVEVKEFNGCRVELSYDGVNFKDVGVVSQESVDEMKAQFVVDQIDGPIKWRDTVNELDAYIEEFTRERESLINRLALEGFALLPAMHPVMGVADCAPKFDDWVVGDIVEVIDTSCFCNEDVKVGDQYPISQRDDDDVKGPVGTFGGEGNYRFVRRP